MAIDISKYVSVDADGELVVNQEQIDSLFDREVSKSVDTYRNKNYKKIQEEVRKELEESAKLSAEEKLKKEREEFEKKYNDKMLEISRREAKSKLDKTLFSEEEIEALMPLISMDEDNNTKIIDTLTTNRKTLLEKTKAALTEELVTRQPSPQTNQNGEETENNIGKMFAQKFSNKKTTSYVDLKGGDSEITNLNK